MTVSAHMSTPSNDTDLARTAEIIATAFGSTTEDARKWMDILGIENSRLWRESGLIAGCLKLIPMGQWFGGRRLSMTGIAGVAVAPEHRSKAVASRLLAATLRELREKGVRLSVLYAATQPVYWRAGYEHAGAHFDIRLSTRLLDVRERGLDVHPITEADDADVEACERTRAMQCNGNTDRGPYLWHRVREPRDGKAQGYLVRGERGIEGYVYFTLKRDENGDLSMHATDLVALTPASARRLIAFLADHRSMCKTLLLHGSLSDPVLALLGELRFDLSLKLHEYWMLRILDLRAALSERGYLPGLRAEVHLDVQDELFPENGGRIVLDVSDGRGTLREGGRGDVRTDIRGFASLFTGHQSAFELAVSGRLDGPADALATAASVFAGPAPWMPDRF